MSVALQIAATKWARAVRERMAATADLRRARLEEKAGIRPDRTWPASQRVTAARKIERKTEKALLSVVEKTASARASVIEASEVIELDAPYSR